LGLVNMLRVVDRVLLVSSVFLLIALYRAANSPLIDQSFYRAVEPVTVDTAGPNSPAWFDGGPLRLPRGVGPTLRQTGPRVRPDRAVAWDSFALAVSEKTSAMARTFRICAGRLSLLRCDFSRDGGEQRSRGCKSMILVGLRGAD
jgi:hypothetical protein